MSDLVLASASETRADLLRQAGLSFEIRPARVDEEAIKAAMLADAAPARDIADQLAERKAVRVSAQVPGVLILGADQVLVHQGRLFSKPAGRDAAIEHLRALSGETHDLLSAAVIAVDGEPVWRHIGEARLTMRPLSDRFIEHYLDQAGAAVLSSVGCYHVEGLGAQLFSRIQGDHYTILGLPLLELLGFLRARNVLLE